MRTSLFLACLLWATALVAQEKKLVQVLNSDNLVGIKLSDTESLQKFIGHVRVLYDGTYFDCDSALNYEERNLLEAYGHVKARMPDGVTMTCKKLIYDANTKIAKVYDHIVLTDKKVTLYTEFMVYYRIPNYGMYPNKGKIVDSATVLTSKIGYYFPDTDMTCFRHDVVLVNPDMTLTSDSLGYGTESKQAFFYAPTHIVGKDTSTVDATRGEYDTARRVANLRGGRNRVENKDYILYGDSLYYEEGSKFGIARTHVEIISKDSSLRITGQYGQFDDVRGISYVTRDPLAIQYDKGDTLYIRADTLYTIENKVDSSRIFRAFRHVRFARNDIQGRADSLVYFYNDSTMQLFRDPVLWSDSSQLTGDTVYVFSRNHTVDSMWISAHGLIVSREDTMGYNQVKGKTIQAKFRDGKIARMDVDGNAESVYYAKDDANHYQGMNRATSASMRIWFEDNKAAKIKFNTTPEGAFSPIYEVIYQEILLDGVRWRASERPTKEGVKNGTTTLPVLP